MDTQQLTSDHEIASAKNSALRAIFAETPQGKPARARGSKLDTEFVDIDPKLKGLKGGYLMQRTFFNTNLGTDRKRGNSTQMNSVGKSPLGM